MSPICYSSQIERAQLARHIEGFTHGPRAIDVEHDLGAVAGRPARGPYAVEGDLVQLQTAIAAAQCARDVATSSGSEYRVRLA